VGAPVARCLAGVGAQQRLELSTYGADPAGELGAVAGVLVDLPGPKQLVTDLKRRVAERFLSTDPFGLGFVIAACNRGPNALAVIWECNSARWRWPHPGQRTRGH
jgi:hypothetical protein